MPTCKKCGAGIIWITTKSGKHMPCDAEPVQYHESWSAGGKVVTPDGAVRSCTFDVVPGQAVLIGHKPHWATCSHAEAFRRKAV